MGRPKKLIDGKPIHRLGYRLLTSVDEHGNTHPVVTIEDAMGIIRGSRDLVEDLARVGVIRTVQSETLRGGKLYSRLDAEAIARQLYGDVASAAEAVGLAPAPVAAGK